MKRSGFRAAAGLAALCFAFGPTLAAAEDKVPSAWSAEPPAIDGASQDWSGVPLVEREKGQVAFAFRNDGERLYVLVELRDKKTLSSIDRTGMTLFIHPDGKKKDYAILFRKMPLRPDDYIALLEKRGTELTEEQRTQIKSRPGYMLFHAEVTNKKVKGEPAVDAGFPQAVFKSTAETLPVVYEFSLPLARPADTAPGLAAAPGESVMIGFEWGGPTEQQRRAAQQRASGASIANEGITDQNTREMVSGSSLADLPKKFTIWMPVQLAKQ